MELVITSEHEPFLGYADVELWDVISRDENLAWKAELNIELGSNRQFDPGFEYLYYAYSVIELFGSGYPNKSLFSF